MSQTPLAAQAKDALKKFILWLATIGFAFFGFLYVWAILKAVSRLALFNDYFDPILKFFWAPLPLFSTAILYGVMALRHKTGVPKIFLALLTLGCLVLCLHLWAGDKTYMLFY